MSDRDFAVSPTATVLMYDPAGRVVQSVNCARIDAELQHIEDCTSWIDPDLAVGVTTNNLAIIYVDLSAAPIVRLRPTSPGFSATAIVADDTDAAVLSLPNPFTLILDGVAHVVDEADELGNYVAEITSPMPATYKVAVECWPYLDYEAEIVAS